MGYQLELRHFKYFLAVAEELHYRKAAEKLCISQPGLSRQIKQMEEILETPLFIRDKKRVTLTAAGIFLKGEIEFIINHLDITKKQLKHVAEGNFGELKIGFLGSAMQTVIPELLLKLRSNYPLIKTTLEELANKAQVNAVLNATLDMGFVRLARVPEELEMRTVLKDTFSLVLPKDHIISENTFKGIHQFAEEEFILFSQDYSALYFDTIMSICEDAGFSPKVSHKSVHAQTIFKLVENKLGIAIVPTSLQYGFEMGVKFIELLNIKQRAELSVIWKKENRNPTLKHCLNVVLSESTY